MARKGGTDLVRGSPVRIDVMPPLIRSIKEADKEHDGEMYSLVLLPLDCGSL